MEGFGGAVLGDFDGGEGEGFFGHDERAVVVG